MTIPSQMNCAHSEGGWCLKCVQAEVEAKELLLEACEALYKIVSNHSLADDRQSHVWEVRLRAWDVIAKTRGGV